MTKYGLAEPVALKSVRDGTFRLDLAPVAGQPGSYEGKPVEVVLRTAIEIDPKTGGQAPSTKGVL